MYKITFEDGKIEELNQVEFDNLFEAIYLFPQILNINIHFEKIS